MSSPELSGLINMSTFYKPVQTRIFKLARPSISQNNKDDMIDSIQTE